MDVKTELNGTQIINDATPGKEKRINSGPGGVSTFEDKKGNIHKTTPGSDTRIIAKDECTTVKGNKTLTVEGDFYLKVMGDWHIEVAGSVISTIGVAKVETIGLQYTQTVGPGGVLETYAGNQVTTAPKIFLN